jgi:hypothetical protein
MQDLLLEMMNQGFIVYTEGDEFTLQKVNTPASPTNYEFDNGTPYKRFPSLAEALTEAQEIVGISKKSQSDCFLWEPELMYKHRGERLPRIMPLGLIGNAAKDIAIEIAKDSAKLWIDSKFKPDEIESWEVRVRPAK